MNPVQKLKKSVHNNPIPYIAVASAASFAVGVLFAPTVLGKDFVNGIFIGCCEALQKEGFQLYALDAAQQAIYHAALEAQ